MYFILWYWHFFALAQEPRVRPRSPSSFMKFVCVSVSVDFELEIIWRKRRGKHACGLFIQDTYSKIERETPQNRREHLALLHYQVSAYPSTDDCYLPAPGAIAFESNWIDESNRIENESKGEQKNTDTAWFIHEMLSVNKNHKRVLWVAPQKNIIWLLRKRNLSAPRSSSLIFVYYYYYEFFLISHPRAVLELLAKYFYVFISRRFYRCTPASFSLRILRRIQSGEIQFLAMTKNQNNNRPEKHTKK